MSWVVELIFDPTCPNVDEARERIRRAQTLAGLRAGWREWNRESAECPAALRHFASPTVLVNGHDIAGAAADTTLDGEAGCRIYTEASGAVSGVPPLELIIAALTSAAAGGQ